MSFSLPDIDIGSWTEYQKQELQRHIDEKVQGFDLQQAISEKISGLQELAGSANPFDQPEPPLPPPPPEPEPVAPPPSPEMVGPTPPAPMSEPPPEIVERGRQAAPMSTFEPVPSPAPRAAPAASTSAAPPEADPFTAWRQQLFASGLNAAQRAGADVQTFAGELGGRLSGAGDDPQAAYASALNAAQASGADVPTFASGFRPPPAPRLPQEPAIPQARTAVQVASRQGVEPGGLRGQARQAAMNYGLDPDIFERQIAQESGFNPNARSPAGAQGVAQFMPGTGAGVAKQLGVSTEQFWANPELQLQGAAQHMSDLKRQFGSDELALAAYNAGPGAVQKYGGIPPYAETQGYVQKIMAGQTSRAGGLPAGAEGEPGWLGLAKEQLNKPYIWGSASGAGGRGTGDIDPQTGLPKGFDCSGYVAWVLKQGLGVDLPAQTSSAYGKTQAISADQARPGDIVFYNMNQGDPHVQHMALYMGDGKIIQAGGTQRNVNIASVNSVGAPEFRRAAGTEAADQRTFVGGALQGAGGLASDVLGGVAGGAQSAAESARQAAQATQQRIESGLSDIEGARARVGEDLQSRLAQLGGNQAIEDEGRRLRELAEQERLARQDQPYNLPEAIYGATRQTGAEMAEAPGQLYGADVAAGQALSGQVVDAAKAAGWDPDPGQERFVRNTVAQVTPSNVLISALTAGQGGLLRQIVQGTAELAGGAVGSELALEKAQEAGWPEWAQAGAQLAGGIGGGLTGALGTRGAIRAAESPLGQAAIRSRLPAEAEAGFAAGMPTGGRGAPDDLNILDTDGRLIPKPSAVENDLILPGREAPEVSQIAGPSGELLSTVTPPTRGVAGIARSVEGARHIPEPTPETLRRMPNLDYLGEDMDDIKGTLQGLAEANAPQIDKFKRGTQKWEELITELAPKVGMSKEEFMQSRIGRGWNEAELLALNAAHLDQTVKAQALADEVAKAGGVKALTPDAKVNLVSNLLDAARLQMVAKGGGSTAGRTLNQQKIRLTQAQARNITGGNERIVAERRLAETTSRAERAEGAAAKTTGLQEERAAAVAEAQKITDRPRAKSLAEQINKAYDDLARYQSMSLAEKDEAFLARQAERAERAARRASALQADDPAQELLKALQTELKAEEKLFAGNRESWMDMAFWAAKKDEMLNGGHWTTPAGAKTIPKDPGIAGQAAWLKAQAKAAARELEASDKQHAKAFNLELRLRDRQTSQALKVLGELGSERITDNILEEFLKVYRSGDAMATAKFLKGMANVGWWDRANILRYAGMLSATVTHGVQAAGGALNLAMMPAAQAIGAPIDIATQAVRGGERTRYAREVPQQVLGMVEGGRASLPEVWEVLKSGISMRAVSQDLGRTRAGFGAEQSATARAGLGALYGGLLGGATAPEDATFEERLGRAGVGAIAGGAGLAAARGRRAGQAIDIAAEGPLRLMQASDLFFRGAGRGAQTRSIAYRTARNEGLVGEAALDRTNEIMQHLDEFPELVDEAEKAAARVVLQEQREVQRFVPRAGVPGAVFSGVVPFSRTPINITAQGLGMSPAGVAGVVDAIKKGQRGEATDRVARTLMGTAIMAAATGLAADDHLTGPYPEDAWERSTLPEGWRPWSFKVPDGKGKTNYIPFGQLGGIGYPLAMGAVYGESLRKGEDVSVETLGKMAVKVGRFGADQTMVTGLNNALNAINEPERYAERFFEGLATQAVPLGSLQRQINQALGAATRDPKGPLEAMLATTVAFAPEVESKISPLGEEVQPGQTGAAAFVAPYRYGAGTAEGEDPVLDALREHEVNIPKGSDIRLGVPFTDAEQRQHQIRSGEVIRDYVERTMATPTYQAADRTKRQVMLQQAVENARNEAAGDTFRGIQSTQGQEEIRRRYLEEQSRKQPAPSR